MTASGFTLLLPDDFDAFAPEIEAKGWYPEAVVVFDGRRFVLNVYDPIRLAQDVAAEIANGGFFFEPNLIVMPTVTRDAIERAMRTIVSRGQLKNFVATDPA